MSITKEEVKPILKKIESMPFGANESAKKAVLKAYEGWKELFALMEREGNFADGLGLDDYEDVVNEHAYDALDSLNNSGCYEQKLELLENLLKVQYSDYAHELNMENFYREMSDTYARMGNLEKASSMYEDALKKDPLWGWGWIGYLRFLAWHKEEDLPKTLEEVKAKIAAGEKFRDLEDLKDSVKNDF